MSKSVKIWLIIGASLVLIGAIIFGGVMMALNWDFSKLSTVKYETNQYEITDNYKNIKVITDTADINFIQSDNTKVVCYEDSNDKHLVTVENDTLIIEISNDKKWYEYIGINFGTPEITVYIPAGEYGALTVNASTGDTKISKEFKFESIDISQTTGDIKCFSSANGDIKLKVSTGNITTKEIYAGSLSLTVSTGKVKVSDIECAGGISLKASTGNSNFTNVRCNNFISTANTGNIILKNVISDENIDIKRTTGDVKFDACDTSELIITTDTGDVKGTLLSDKVFIVKTDTGSIKVPETTNGGKCKITTDTGDIKIEIK